MFLTPEVCKLPFASQFWLRLPTAVCDKFQYLHFSVALKRSRLNRGSLNMEQSSRLVLQKESVPHLETCLEHRHLEPLPGIRTIYKLRLVIVKMKKNKKNLVSRVSGVLRIRTRITCWHSTSPLCNTAARNADGGQEVFSTAYAHSVDVCPCF